MFGKALFFLMAAIAYASAEANDNRFVPGMFDQFSEKFQEVLSGSGSANLPQLPISNPIQSQTGNSRRQLGDVASTIKDKIPFPGSRYHN